MLVREIIDGMAHKTITRNELAEKYAITNRTISNILKRLGFEWSKEEGKHKYLGDADEFESIMNKDFQELLYNPQKQNATRKIRATTAKKTPSNVNTLEQREKPSEAQNKPYSELDESLSKIDELLNSGIKREKVYKGFYIDEDLANVIDSVADGNKSKLVNEVLRAVFQSKGLL